MTSYDVEAVQQPVRPPHCHFSSFPGAVDQTHSRLKQPGPASHGFTGAAD